MIFNFNLCVEITFRTQIYLPTFGEIFLFIFRIYLFLVVWKYILICLMVLDSFQLYFHPLLCYFISLYA
jgi:hypothetical protein